MTCPKCGEQVEFNEDDILNEQDWLEMTEARAVSLRCPHCWERNIISYTDMYGKKETYIKIEAL